MERGCYYWRAINFTILTLIPAKKNVEYKLI